MMTSSPPLEGGVSPHPSVSNHLVISVGALAPTLGASPSQARETSGALGPITGQVTLGYFNYQQPKLINVHPRPWKGEAFSCKGP